MLKRGAENIKRLGKVQKRTEEKVKQKAEIVKRLNSLPQCHIFHTPSITSLAPLYMGHEIVQILHSLTEGTFVLRVKVFIQMKLLLVHYNYSESFTILKVHK